VGVGVGVALGVGVVLGVGVELTDAVAFGVESASEPWETLRQG